MTDEAAVEVGTAAEQQPAPATQAGTDLKRYDPFSLMDHLDEDAMRKELAGIACDDLVYVVQERGKPVTGLSKAGIDECRNMLAHQGEVLRDGDLKVEYLGEGEDRTALFQATVERWAVRQDGHQVKLDSTVGLKSQSLYREAAEELTLDSKFKFGKKYRGQEVKDGTTGESRPYTWRDVLEEDSSYLEWIAENAHDEDLQGFAKAILNGEDVRIEPGRALNPFWFEAGGMKAYRNASFRLVPANLKAEVIARAKQAGQVLETDERGHPVETGGAPNQQNRNGSEDAATDNQRNKLRQVITSHVVKDAEREQLTAFIDNPKATKVAMSKAIDYWMGQVKKRKAALDPDEAAEQARIDAEGKDMSSALEEAVESFEGEVAEATERLTDSDPSQAERGSSDKPSETDSPVSAETTQATTAKTSTDEAPSKKVSDAMQAVIEEIEKLLTVATPKAKQIWEGYFGALVETGGTIDDYKKVRRALYSDPEVKKFRGDG